MTMAYVANKHKCISQVGLENTKYQHVEASDKHLTHLQELHLAIQSETHVSCHWQWPQGKEYPTCRISRQQITYSMARLLTTLSSGECRWVAIVRVLVLIELLDCSLRQGPINDNWLSTSPEFCVLTNVKNMEFVWRCIHLRRDHKQSSTTHRMAALEKTWATSCQICRMNADLISRLRHYQVSIRWIPMIVSSSCICRTIKVPSLWPTVALFA